VKWPLIFLLIICIPSVFAISNSSNYAIEILVDPGMQSNSSNFSTNSAIEPIVGSGESTNYKICLGFFCRYFPFPPIILMIAIGLFGGMLFFAGWAKKSKHIPIQILFMICVLLLAITSVAIMSHYYSIFSVSVALYWIFFFVLSFFIITIFLDKKIYKVKKKY